MAEEEIDRLIGERIGDDQTDLVADGASLQALAVLLDADLTDEQRTQAFGTLMSAMLERLSTEERERFVQIASDEGERAALTYLTRVAEPSD